MPHVTPAWKLAHTIHLCVLWGLFSQLLPNAPWSQFQFAATTSTWLAIGNLISKVSLVWEGRVQSWNDCRVKEGSAANRQKCLQLIWGFFCRKNIDGQYSYWGTSLWKSSFLDHLLCLNVSYDCLCRVNSRKDVIAPRQTALCRWWCAVWFVSWDCNEIGGLMNLPKGVRRGTMWLMP